MEPIVHKRSSRRGPTFRSQSRIIAHGRCGPLRGGRCAAIPDCRCARRFCEHGLDEETAPPQPNKETLMISDMRVAHGGLAKP